MSAELADKTNLELPEEIDLQLELANVGSRTLAILADLFLGFLVLFIVYAVIALLGNDLARAWLVQFGKNTLMIFFLLLIFGFQWGYFNVFEWLWNGQTPGKRMLQLRVIKVDGSPISWIDVLLRNLARPIDTLGPMGLIGLALIFLQPRAQRLGDLLAGTLVIHETPIDWSIFDEVEKPEAKGTALQEAAIRLNPEQWELLHRFLNRREALLPEARERLSASLQISLKPLTMGTSLERSTLSPEAWLLELARRS